MPASHRDITIDLLQAGAFITEIEGSFSNVIGLPLAETLAMLARAGVELPWKG